MISSMRRCAGGFSQKNGCGPDGDEERVPAARALGRRLCSGLGYSEGSNRWGGGTSEKRLPAIIWIDGEIGAEHPGDRSWGGLHDGALATMAEILGVNTTPQAGHRQGPA